MAPRPESVEGVDVEDVVAREVSVGEDVVVVSRVAPFGGDMTKVRAAVPGASVDRAGGALRLDDVAVGLGAEVEVVIGVVGSVVPPGVSTAGSLESRLRAAGDLELLVSFRRCAEMIDLQKA